MNDAWNCGRWQVNCAAKFVRSGGKGTIAQAADTWCTPPESEESMNNFTYYSPTEFVFGHGVEAGVGKRAAEKGFRKALVV